jgi:hypothetical protein
MRKHLPIRIWAILAFVSFVWLPVLPAYADGPTSVLTRSNNNSRTGANLNETILNTSNVNVSQFGKLFSRPVDGQIYAQPLYVPNVSIPGKGTHNVVYVATQHDSVYAFDVDDPSASTPLWHVSLGASVPSSSFGPPGYADIQIEVGATSTPVIDPNTGTLYVVAVTQDSDAIRHRLHALDLQTGAEKFGGPVVISGSVSLTGGPGNDVVFDTHQQLQRPGLLLSNGVVYVAFGSYGDATPYHGWIFGYDAANLQRVYIYNTTPHGSQGSIWQSGQGLSADAAGNIYALVANGSFNANSGGSNYGDSFIKLNPSSAVSGVLSVIDWFTPYDQAQMSADDMDLGSIGPLLIPGTSLVLGGDKRGEFYLVNRNDMGYYNGPDGPDQIVQEFFAATGSLMGSPVYWNSPSGPLIYVWGANDALKAYSFDGSQLQTTPVAVGTTHLGSIEPGGILSLSANRSIAGSGIVWALHPTIDASHQTAPGVLRAYDASNVGVELWNSEQNAARDRVGAFAKFCPPTIADGKVFVATFSNRLDVYGVFAPGIIAQPATQFVDSGQPVTLTVSATGQAPFSYQWYHGSTGDTSTPVGTDSPIFATSLTSGTASYWVRVSNSAGHADSHTALVIVGGHRTYLPLSMTTN